MVPLGSVSDLDGFPNTSKGNLVHYTEELGRFTMFWRASHIILAENTPGSLIRDFSKFYTSQIGHPK